MGSQQKPILEVAKFGFADNIRGDRNRLPGMCRSIVNLAPNLSGSGERVRRGYLAYTAVTAPSGAQILQVTPVQSPSQQDVHIWFASSGVYQNPYWGGQNSASSPGTTNIKVNEIKTFTASGGSFPAANQMTLTGVDSFTLSTTNNYYKNWTMQQSTKYATVTAYSYSSAAGGTATFTFFEDVDSSGLNYSASGAFEIDRNFHDNLTFNPTYNTTLTDPPCVVSDSDQIFFSGGQSSSGGNAGIISQYINRAFFSGFARTFTYTGSYVSEETLRSRNLLTAIALSSNVNGLPAGTYWLGYAFVYDGFQIGQLQRHETIAQYTSSTNYRATATQLDIALPIAFGRWNKRITDIIFYLALDLGMDTSTTGRQSQYYAVAKASLVGGNNTNGNWTYVGGSTQQYQFLLSLVATAWSGKTNVYSTDSGIVEAPSDISYSYSDRLILGTRHILSNVYVNSEAATDRAMLFTNPIGGNADFNSGIAAISMFSNEDGFYRLRAKPTVGTRITGMRAVGLEDILVLKDRGTLHGRINVDTRGIPDIDWDIVSYDIGCATLRGHTFSDDAWIYFAGYDDIYRYRNGGFQRLIENPETQNDWLYNYQVLLQKTAKESTVCFYLPERQIIFDIAQSASTGKQVSFYPDYGWREVKLAQSGTDATTFVKWTTRLQNGTVLVIDSSGNVYQWSNPTTGAFYPTDNGTAIIPYLDTGSFIPSGDEGMDTVLNYWALSRTFDAATTGQLDIDLYKDGSIVRSYTSQDKTSIFLPINSVVSDARQGNTWRLVINSNTSTPEHLNAGTILTLNKIFLYGELRKRSKRASEHSAGFSTTPLSSCISNTISGKQEVTVNKTPTVFTWDSSFIKTYTGTEGTGIPTYRFEFEPPYVIGSDKTQVEEIVITAKTLTTITLASSSDSTLVKFQATE